MSKKEVTLDNQTYVEEKTKRTRKVPCSDKMLENLEKGRGRRKQFYLKKKEGKKSYKTYKKKKELKKEKEEFDKLKEQNLN